MTDDALDEWEDLERAKPCVGAPLPDVQLRLSKGSGKTAPRRATAWLALRRGAADWIREREPRFRIQIGGRDADRIRLLKDHERGQFECVESKGGTMRIGLGHVTLWPDEARDPVALEWSVDAAIGAMVLTLPQGFAKAAPNPAQKATSAAPPVPQPLAPNARIIDRRPHGTVSLGEPAPGRSALDERRRRGG